MKRVINFHLNCMRHCPRNKMEKHMQIITSLNTGKFRFFETYQYLCQAAGINHVSAEVFTQALDKGVVEQNV